MKYYFMLVLLFFIIRNDYCQTYAELPAAKNILVVYKRGDSVSEAIKNEYVNRRNIPLINVIKGTFNLGGLEIPDSAYNKQVILDHNGESIKRNGDCTGSNGYPCDTLAWQYYEDYIAAPIRTYLNNTIDPATGNYLRDQIRYIVLCKGIPFKIQSGGDWGPDAYRNLINISVDAMLSILNTNSNNNLPPLQYYTTDPKGNPYYNCDPNFTMDYRFKPNFFTNSQITLSYLVSRLDGINLDETIQMIDRSVNADTSGTGTFILDFAGTYQRHINDAASAQEILNNLGFNSIFGQNIFANTSNVIGYTSQGQHAGYVPDYLQSLLQFSYLNGAVCNTFESFNCCSMLPIFRKGQGLISEFVKKRTADNQAGTSGVGDAFEPFTGGIPQNAVLFPAYAIGYGVVDAVYQAIPEIPWHYVVIGDPLTRIYKTLTTDTIKVNTAFNSLVTDHKIIVPENVTLTLNDNAVVEFKKNAQLQIKGRLVVGSNVQLNFNSYSTLELQDLSLTNSSITFKDCARLKSANKLTLNSNSTLTLADKSSATINSFHLFGDCKLTVTKGVVNTNKLIIHSCKDIINNGTINIMKSLIADTDSKKTISATTNGQINCSNIDTLFLDNCSFDNVGLSVSITEQLANTYYSLKNIVFTNQSFQFSGKEENQLSLALSDLKFINNQSAALSLSLINNLEINNVEISNSSQLENGLNLERIQNGYIHNVTINNSKKGIKLIHGSNPTVLLSDASYNYIIDSVKIYNSVTGYDFEGINCDNLKITNSNISNSTVGINVYNFTCSPQISNNVISNCNIAILLANGTDVLLKNNNITSSLCGISLNNITEPLIVNNQLIGINHPKSLSGIFSSSSNGIYRLNNISYFKNGIELGNSSPKIGQNTITDNIEHGLYITAGSSPDLSSSYIYNTLPATQVPISGFNLIKDNGNSNNCSLTMQSEIYFNQSKIALAEGCNSIIDDRNKSGCNNQLLIEGSNGDDTEAYLNYWGNHPIYGNDPNNRTAGDVYFDLNPYLPEECNNIPNQQNSLVLRNAANVPVDTVFTTTKSNIELSGINLDYAKSLNNYLNNNYTESITGYKNIISAYGNNIKSAEAYKKLFAVNKLKKSSKETFIELKNYYDNKRSTLQDSILINILSQLSNLCLIEIKNLDAAIDNFLVIAANNPNNDKGFYACVDALSASLLQDSTNQLSKKNKLNIAGIEDFNKRYADLMRNRSLGSFSADSKNIPQKNELLSNYPNPFNPETMISFSIKEQSNVKLVIFDVLGRKVKELVNEEKLPGTYNVKFNAGNLSSGIYFYSIITNNFVQTKKMLLLK